MVATFIPTFEIPAGHAIREMRLSEDALAVLYRALKTYALSQVTGSVVDGVHTRDWDRYVDAAEILEERYPWRDSTWMIEIVHAFVTWDAFAEDRAARDKRDAAVSAKPPRHHRLRLLGDRHKLAA